VGAGVAIGVLRAVGGRPCWPGVLGRGRGVPGATYPRIRRFWGSTGGTKVSAEFGAWCMPVLCWILR